MINFMIRVDNSSGIIVITIEWSEMVIVDNGIIVDGHRMLADDSTNIYTNGNNIVDDSSEW